MKMVMMANRWVSENSRVKHWILTTKKKKTEEKTLKKRFRGF